MQRQTITIDATNITPGRVASRVAKTLMGKTQVTYRPNLDNGPKVVVEHINQLKLTKQRLEGKVYIRHSGHPGGLKKTSAKDLTPTQIVRKAVYSMLPKNRLRNKRLKRLTITE